MKLVPEVAEAKLREQYSEQKLDLNHSSTKTTKNISIFSKAK